MKKNITGLVVVGDLHANSTVALCPPRVTITDGGSYESNSGQAWLWGKWKNFWREIGKEKKRWKKWHLVINGDLVDGDHHNTPQVLVRNMYNQHQIALEILEPALKLKPDSIYVVKGTAAHVGKTAEWEEYIADDIGAVPDKRSKSPCWYHLRLNVQGVRFDIAHHGNFGRLPWTGPNTLNALTQRVNARYYKLGKKPPDVIIRSHTHHYGESGRSDYIRTKAISCPSWQLSTEFANRIAPGELLDVGGLVFECKDGRYTYNPITYSPPMDGEERL